MKHKKDFIPAFHYNFLTPIYSPFMRIFFWWVFRNIADKIRLKKDEKLLDVGCGPGHLLKVLHKKYPSNNLTGLDIDPKILKIARKRLPESIKLIESSATDIPLPGSSIDVIVSTLAIHHFESLDKQKMIHEAHRILKPNGRFLLFDFTSPYNLFGKIFVKLFRKVEGLDDAINGKYVEWMEKSGFKNVKSIYRSYGMMELISGTK